MAEASGIAKQACDDWARLRAATAVQLPSDDKVRAIEQTANEATNHDLEFVVLGDHLRFAATAAKNGDVTDWTRQAASVDADCLYLQQGTFREHLNDSVGP